MASTRGAADPPRASRRLRRAGLATVALLATGLLLTACGGGSTTATESSAARGGSTASNQSALLAYVNCMRTHGEPNMPNLSGSGGHISMPANSGVDPNSPQFTKANNACQKLLSKGGPSGGQTITPAQQADYLKAAACMRSHGVPNFPDPTFQNNSVTFNAPGANIDTSSSQYKSALATCEKLIPAGLPYSPSSS